MIEQTPQSIAGSLFRHARLGTGIWFAQDQLRRNQSLQELIDNRALLCGGFRREIEGMAVDLDTELLKREIDIVEAVK